ncbi:MAG: sigma factor-like helix-turn-helix DNA-binding protein, partial [Bacillota bacterium]
ARDMPEWKRSLIDSYRHSLRCVATATAMAKGRIEMTPDEDHGEEIEDLELLSGMAGDVAYGLTWLRRGYPDEVHTHPRVSAAPEAVLDKGRPLWQPSGPISKDTMQHLASLSRREREVYLMYHVERLDKSEIARTLRITRQSVQVFLDRAKAKVG